MRAQHEVRIARALAAARTSAEPTRPRMAGDVDLRVWLARAASLVVVVARGSRAASPARRARRRAGPRAPSPRPARWKRDLRASSRASRAPWSRRRAACPPRSAGSSAGRRDDARGPWRRSPSPRRPLPLPADRHAELRGGRLDELAHAVLLAGGDHEVLGLVLLQHQPLRLDVVARVAPVALARRGCRGTGSPAARA